MKSRKFLALVRTSFLFLIMLVLTQAVHAQTSTRAAFQQYEGGYMIWRADTGGIWVLWGEDNLFFSARYYPQADYEDLPDNPTSDNVPDGYYRPVNGFGRVWHNFDEVRVQLGWAATPEQEYTVTFSPTTPTAGGLEQELVNFPDGSKIVIREDNSWGLVGQPRPIQSLPPTATFPASIQAFENGYMLWWSETGDIWVLINSGPAQRYTSLQYGTLPDNAIPTTPPPGRLKPVLGFGKVWGQYPAVHLPIGWAIDHETGYQMNFERTLGRLTVSSPYGTIILSGDTWKQLPPQ